MLAEQEVLGSITAHPKRYFSLLQDLVVVPKLNNLTLFGDILTFLRLRSLLKSMTQEVDHFFPDTTRAS